MGSLFNAFNHKKTCCLKIGIDFDNHSNNHDEDRLLMIVLMPDDDYYGP